MRNFNKLLLTALLGLLTITGAFGQTTGEQDVKTVTFKFQPGQDGFYIPWGGNGTELTRLYDLVDRYRAEIISGRMPIRVNGYSSGEFKTAVVRSNRVKSMLITYKGMLEEHFLTRNHTTAYNAPDGKTYRDIVVVTLHIPAQADPEPDNARLEQERRARETAAQAERDKAESDKAERDKAERERADAERAAREQAERERAAAQQAGRDRLAAPAATNGKPYNFAVRTNLLYDAFLLPTLGVEWRASRHLGIKLDGSLAWWGGETDNVQKVWALSPEVRWYLLDKKQLYVGLGGNYGEYNTHGYLLGKLWPDDTGYQGTLWSVGAVVGYQLALSHSLSIDFNLGLGYMKSEYDSFSMINETRVFNKRNQSKDFWGPTQAGISLVWKIGGKK